MKQKAFVLQNKGMNRDTSISKVGESTAYENRNIRIIARDNDTLLSVTNERGTKEIPLPNIVGTLIGWNVLNNHILLFTHDTSWEGGSSEGGSSEPEPGGSSDSGSGGSSEPSGSSGESEGDSGSGSGSGSSGGDEMPHAIKWDTTLQKWRVEGHVGVTGYFETKDIGNEAASGTTWDDVFTLDETTNTWYANGNFYAGDSILIGETGSGNYINRDDDEILSWDSIISAWRINGDIYTTGGVGAGAAYAESAAQLSLMALSQEYSGPDYIYRIDYEGDTFIMRYGRAGDYTTGKPLFNGNLGFEVTHPIESIVTEESEEVQKIYWVDGKNVLRFVNFMEEKSVVSAWTALATHDDTIFDSNRITSFGVSATVEKDNSGNTRSNGVVQYLLTYFNKHGQETGYVWVSDIVYLSPMERGGAADETNNNRITLHFTGLDTSFTNFRVYSIFRSNLNGETVSYLVGEANTPEASTDTVTVVDDGAHLVLQDTTRLLYLGSQPVVAGTMVTKDQTLFLGDLKSVGRTSYDALETAIRNNMFVLAGSSFAEGDSQSSCISFEYSNENVDSYNSYDTRGKAELADIPYKNEAGNYSYRSQLVYSSSNILTFKGGEKYRFALKFKLRDGSETDAFWIGDKVNTKYPVVNVNGNAIKRVIAVCSIPGAVIAAAKAAGFSAVQLLIAEATYADRSVKAQGIVNPTMFNVWERYNKRTYAVPSWIARTRGLEMANRHFAPIHNSIHSTGEIQCNYWRNLAQTPAPYYQWDSATQTYTEEFEGAPDYDALMLVYTIYYDTNSKLPGAFYSIDVRIVTGKTTVLDGQGNKKYESQMKQDYFYSGDFTDTDWKYISPVPGDTRSGMYVSEPRDEDGNIMYKRTAQKAEARGSVYLNTVANTDTIVSSAYNAMKDVLMREYDIPETFIIDSTTFGYWCARARHYSNNSLFFNENCPGNAISTTALFDAMVALNYVVIDQTDNRWHDMSDIAVTNTGSKTPAYYKKHLMFIDENVVTLDSPEISYEAVSFDGADLNFRIVGVAKMSSVITDYTVDATPSGVPGISLDTELFSGNIDNRHGNINGLTAWPLWKELGLDLKEEYDDDSLTLDDRTSNDYKIGNNVVRYWLYLWQKAGTISGYNFSDEETKKKVENASVLNRKVIANLRFSYNTVYLANALNSANIVTKQDIRMVNELSGSYALHMDSTDKYYTGEVQMMLTVPGYLKYPLVYSKSRPAETTFPIGSDSFDAYMSSSAPVLLEYKAGAHAVIGLESGTSGGTYTQRLLPYMFYPSITLPAAAGSVSSPKLPWDENNNAYAVAQDPISSTANHSLAQTITENDQYLFIGEIYENCHDYTTLDKRYGGITLSDVQNNRFVAAGPMKPLSGMSSTNGGIVYGNQGDTYFQRWDDLRIKPFSNDSDNNVIDIVSAMVETHVNLDGRTDKQRGIPQLASIDTTTFGQLNRVYSQQNNFSVRRDLDEDFNIDAYRSSITWTMEKHDMASVDEWSHITLASTLKLDSDKGICRALRKLQNNIIAFQDKGISEVLFNSRTQVSTMDGVPVEIANSGKVDGKRYISNKYGCLNKWSIVEGKGGLYFVDNINKSFCSLTYSQYGRAGVQDISTRLGFATWFRTRNSIVPWMPNTFNNIVSFYDRVHSDIYLVRRPTVNDADAPALVYNELLGVFTSFFDYGSIPMMTNVEDRFISFLRGKLWLQNEGAYGDFHGTYKPFWVQYRVTPDPYGDKIWTNVEYRADFYRTLSGTEQEYKDSDFLDDNGIYQPNETFDFMRFWDEYQTTEPDETKYNLSPIKKFRIWRQAIPRATVSEQNPHGLDRIRNPWLNLMFKKNAPTATTKQDLMQLHDIIVTYYE